MDTNADVAAATRTGLKGIDCGLNRSTSVTAYGALRYDALSTRVGGDKRRRIGAGPAARPTPSLTAAAC